MVKGVGKEVEVYSFDEVATYAALDAEWTWKLWQKYSEDLDRDNLRGLFRLEMDVLEVISNMELHGANIDVDQLSKLKNELEVQLETTKATIYRLAGKAFNINSIPEKQKLIFSSKADGGRGLKPKGRNALTPKGQLNEEKGNALTIADYSVSEPALKSFQGKDALVDALLNYADLNKLLTTYVIPYLGGDITRTTSGKAKIVAKKSLLVKGKIHTDFIQYGAETGRFASRNPNLQNIPNSKSINGKAIRNLFVAPDGYKMIVADYSQIEPRVTASFSGDRLMCEGYLNGEDVYVTMGKLMGIDDRPKCKTLFLAVMYGVGPDKVAADIGCSVSEARDLLDQFAGKFPTVMRYKKQVISDARRRGPVPHALTYLKRRRYLPNLRSNVMWERAQAERQAFNTVIQGSSADLIKLAMIRAHKLIPDKASLILTIHDELVTVTPENLVEETEAAIREAMEGINALSIPLLAEVSIANRWGDAK
jgi:DNA polymerase I-like protein with 3'-5' exonuclease and polymerase domains